MSDGSIRIQWPYLAVRQGIVAEAEAPTGPNGTVHLRERGKFTSQLVKFVHHVSGEAHFSLTGKVRTEVGRQSFRLDGPIGRIFELSVFYPAEFKALERLKPDRVYINFEGESDFPQAFQIRGEWRRKASVVANTLPRGVPIGPLTRWKHRESRETAPVAFLAPPLTCPIQDFVLCITCSPAPLPKGSRRSGLVLMGAFDEHEQSARMAAKPIELTRFLAAMYPTDSPEDIVRAVGSIDLHTGPPAG